MRLCSSSLKLLIYCDCTECRFCFIDRDEEEMNKREDRREGSRHCKERSSKDKVIKAFFFLTYSWPLLDKF